MPPRRRAHSKSASISSSPDAIANGMPPPATPALKASPPLKRRGHRATTSSAASPVVAGAKSVIHESGGPSILGFVSVVILNFVLEAGLQTVTSFGDVGDLAAVSRHLEAWEDVVGLLAWKIVLLAVYWFCSFDAYDVASSTLLLTTPSTILLGLFYLIRPQTLVLTTASSLVASTAPFFLLRPLSPSRDPRHSAKSTLRNRAILSDPYTTILVSILAAAIFAVLLEAAFATFLPVYFITHFSHLRSLEAAHLGPGGLLTLLLACLPAGFASTGYLFTPPTGTPPAHETFHFDPTTSDLNAHVYWNLWGWYSPRQKELLSRTAILTMLVFAETVVHVWGTLEGAELQGAAGYAGVWSLGVVLVGLVLEWVGEPSD